MRQYHNIRHCVKRFILLFVLSLIPALSSASDFVRENAVVSAVRKAGPAVVNIASESVREHHAHPFSGFGLDPFFDSFFKDFFEPKFQQRPKRSSLGSGVIIDGQRGLILTNAHVISNVGKIIASLKDEREFEADIVGAAPDFDLAVLRIATKDKLPDIKMGTSDDLMIGETVIAIGNPFGFSHTVTTGVVSALNRSIRTNDRVFHEFIQIDASINPGNSGGPLLNINGILIGINTAIYAKAQGIGFAIPISRAKKIISDLIEYGEVVPAWIGVDVQDLTPRLAAYLNFPKEYGVIVKSVVPDSPAKTSGILSGDAILALNGRKIMTRQDYVSVMRSHSSGDRLKVMLWRNHRTQSLLITAASFPIHLAPSLVKQVLGISVSELSASVRRKYRVSNYPGVIITEISSSSGLFRIGAREGDIISKMNDIEITTLADFYQAIIKYRHKESVVLLIVRGGRGYHVTVDF